MGVKRVTASPDSDEGLSVPVREGERVDVCRGVRESRSTATSELVSESESSMGIPSKGSGMSMGMGRGCSIPGRGRFGTTGAAVNEVRSRREGCSWTHWYLASTSRSLVVGVGVRGTLLGPGVAFRGPGSSLFCRSSSDEEAT